jgi:hypothetical protein
MTTHAHHTHSDTHPHMNTSPQAVARPLYERILKFLVIGGFKVLLFYVKLLAGILKIVIAAVKKVPLAARRDADA